MESIKALIIDDEEPGRRIIREFLEFHSDIRLVAECRDAHEALQAIYKYNPELLFLDIQMPEINGFELLEQLDEIPYVIFTTAYDEYAIKAFDVNAVDYLLKPIEQERFDQAVARVRTQIREKKHVSDKIESLLNHLQRKKNYLEHMVVKDSGKMFILNVTDIYWIEAIEDYIKLHTNQGSFLVLQTLKNTEIRLNPELFIRGHRSYLINLNAVKEIHPWSNGRLKCYLKDGRDIILSREGSKRLKRLMI